MMRKIFLGLLVVCLASGGTTHVIDIVRGGWLPYSGVPLPLNAFWTSLAIVDFAAVFLLWRHLNAGLILTAVIMVADVAINSYATYGLAIPFKSFAPLQAQTLFLGFVIGAVPVIWARDRNLARKEIP